MSEPSALVPLQRRRLALQVEAVRRSGLFDAEWYLGEYRDSARLGIDPIEHYLLIGAKLGRRPSRDFPLAGGEPITSYIAHVNPLLARLSAAESLSAPAPHAADPGDGLPAFSHNRHAAMPTPDLLDSVPAGFFSEQLTRLLRDKVPPGFDAAFTSSERSLADALKRLAERQERPLVSIIMPTHNRAGIIGDAIRSITAQGYDNWELHVCDDGSTDGTASVIAAVGDKRILHHQLSKVGAAAARNAGLAKARGEIIAYLDSDNYWHPHYLSRMVLALLEYPGHSCAYGNFVDYVQNVAGRTSIKHFRQPAFGHENLLQKNFIDLNTFVHRRELYDAFGGFNDRLTRRQDYDLILKYTWLRDPLPVPEILALYQRNEGLDQITRSARHDDSCIAIINDSVTGYFTNGLPLAGERPVKRVTIISWDLCRNHFSKPFALAEALAEQYEVQLIAFKFFEEEIFPPLAGVVPKFETVYLPGADFPDFTGAMEQAVAAITGDVIYVLKPRLPSLGVALLANARRGTPIILEINDLETVVGSPKSRDQHKEVALHSVDLGHKELISPYSNLWSQLMDPLAKMVPVLVTHNRNIDRHFGWNSLYMRNLKDEAVYDPELYDRDAIRAELGFAPDDRVILFGGLLRKHKGIYELVELVERLDDPRYKLLFAGSRATPDQQRLIDKYGDRVRVLPPQDRTQMARINYAADLVILWLDPAVPASHYQFPYKATDALAMGASIIANDISDLGELGRQGYLRLVPFGDWDAMSTTVRDVFEDTERTEKMRAAGIRLFQRQFSYAAARGNFALAARRALAGGSAVLPAAKMFAERYDAFRQLLGVPAPAPKPAAMSNDDASVVTTTPARLTELHLSAPDGVMVIMPTLDVPHAHQTARMLVRRAGMPVTVVIIADDEGQGLAASFNHAFRAVTAKYLVYVGDDAFPGADWLRNAHDRLESTGKGLLAFNCGRSDGRIARFGMVRADWARTINPHAVFSAGLGSPGAEAPLSRLAIETNAFVYEPNAALASTVFTDTETAATPERLARIVTIDVERLADITHVDPTGVAIIMPCIDTARGEATARLLLGRAGMAATVFIVEDTLRQGFIKTLNQAAARLDVRYVVYLAEDAVPGFDWLKLACDQLDSSGKGLLAFNCGKWHGRVAAFGMVRKNWVERFYGGPILSPHYKTHRADNELTVIARATGAYIYAAAALLIENDPRKIFRSAEAEASNFTEIDKQLFKARFKSAFDGLVTPDAIAPLYDEYFNQRKLAKLRSDHG